MSDALPDPLTCPHCRIVLRDGDTGLGCPACGHRIAYDATERPDDPDELPGIHGG